MGCSKDHLLTALRWVFSQLMHVYLRKRQNVGGVAKLSRLSMEQQLEIYSRCHHHCLIKASVLVKSSCRTTSLSNTIATIFEDQMGHQKVTITLRNTDLAYNILLPLNAAELIILCFSVLVFLEKIVMLCLSKAIQI